MHENTYNRRLILTRWLAGAGVIGGTLVTVHLLRFPLPELSLLVLGAVILLYNAVLWRVGGGVAPERLIILQVALDWLCMALFVHLTGGITSPALIFFVLHIIIVTILFPGQSPYLYAAVVVAGVGTIALLEAAEVLPHYAVIPGLPDEVYHVGGYVAAQILFLGAALAATAYITTSIMQPLRQAEKERERFIHVLTHELRSPATGSLSLIKILLQGLAGEMTPQQRDIITRLARRMDGMLEMINELLGLFSDKARPQPLEQIVIQAAIQAVMDDLRVQAQEKCVQFTAQLPGEPLMVSATHEGLERIFTNLIGNAIKYTPENGAVSVRVRRVLRPQSARHYAEISVSDTGIGIPQESLTQIGKEFFRAPNASGIVGTGLGLATVKQRIEQFSGTLSIDSEVGKGSTFTVRLPI